MTLTKIRKRDGRLTGFNEEKIARAVEKAFNATYKSGREEEARRLADEVLSTLEVEGQTQPDMEHTQDLVERVLMDSDYVQAIKFYILHREECSRIRETDTRLMRTYEDITSSKAKDSNTKREDANIDGDAAVGSMLKFGSEGVKQFYGTFVLNPDHARAHREGSIRTHDPDFLTLITTCYQIDIQKPFERNFPISYDTLRESNDISSYAALCCITIQSNQGDQHGGQSVVNFDYGMAGGVRKIFAQVYHQDLIRALMLLEGREDPERKLKVLIMQLKTDTGLTPTLEDYGNYFVAERAAPTPAFGMTKQVEKAQTSTRQRAAKGTDRATYQAMEALIHNPNIMHSRVGAQTPFSSINYGTNTSPESRMVMKNVIPATEAGLGNGGTPVFPIQILRAKEEVNYNPGELNYNLFQLVVRCSAKRLFPSFSFLDTPFNLQYYKPGQPETEITYTRCRTRVIGNVYNPSREICNGRDNLSSTTISLPQPAIKVRGDLDVFSGGLGRMLGLCVEQLLERFGTQCRKYAYNYPFLMGQGMRLDSDKLDWDNEVREVLRYGTLTVGFIDLAETLKAPVGTHHGKSEKIQVLNLEIISHMRARMGKKVTRRGLNFFLIATPAEGSSGRFIKLDRACYDSIEEITDQEYHINPFHVPVYHPISAYGRIRIEAPYHVLTSVGHISYIEMDDDPTDNLEAFKKVIRRTKESGIGYGSTNHPVDRGPVCGSSGIIGDQYPGCGHTEADDVSFEHIRCITGYLVGILDRFNNGKRTEERGRVKHTV